MTTVRDQDARIRRARFATDLLVTVAVLIAAAVVISANWPWRNRIVVPGEPVSIEGLATRGSSSAKVVLLEYSDFQCPSCGAFVRGTLPRIERQYVRPGLVRIVFRHLPLPQHEFAWPAAMAAECALREGKFWEMHDLSFKNQRALTEVNLVAWAAELGLESSRFRTCLTDDGISRRIEADMDSAADMHIAATPTLIIGNVQADGRVKLVHVTSASFADIQVALDRALAGAEGRSTTRSILLGYGAGLGGLAVAVAGTAWWWLRLRRRRREPAPA